MSTNKCAFTRSPGDRASALLRDLARLHVRAQRATLACNEANNTACMILTELGRARSMTLAQLTRKLRLDKGWMSRAVEQLVHNGLIDKAASDRDRRAIALSLTRAGHAEHRRVAAILDAQVSRVIDRVPSRDRAAVTRVLCLLHESYLAELADQSEREKVT